MESNEIRIGNYIKDRLDRTFKINGFKDENVYLLLSNNDKIRYNIKTIKPIKINEYILLKVGFIKYGKLHDSYRLNPFIIEADILGNNYSFRKMINSKESYLLKEIKYLHELQNLYFELTNKELPYNE